MQHYQTAQLVEAAQDSEQSDVLLPKVKEGLFGPAANFDGDALLETETDYAFDTDDAFSYGGWMNLQTGNPACLISKIDENQSLRGFDVVIRKRRAVAHFIHSWNDDAIQVMTADFLPKTQWLHVMVTYDGSGKASGVKIYFDGKPQQLTIRYDNLTGSIANQQPIRIGLRGTSAYFQGMIDYVDLYQRVLSDQEVHDLVTQQLARGILNLPAENRTSLQKEKLKSFYLSEIAPAKFSEPFEKLETVRAQIKQHATNAPTTMVMQELDELRETALLMRGQYDQPGKKVTANVPAVLVKKSETIPASRLGLAQWLVDRQNPLTARVTVNRFWQQFFGTGLVKTVDDFGSQGEWPSHPDMLDWLAVEFMESGWNVKHLQKLIVMSATYRQSSKAESKPQGSKSKRLIDPENRLLARGPRFRLDAEVIRDQALAMSGLLVEKIGGASVKPYQPKGLWEAVSYDGELTYQPDFGAGLYRRSTYTYWKRQSPPPGMLSFDAPTRETCTVQTSPHEYSFASPHLDE